jgi:hypothetical protein
MSWVWYFAYGSNMQAATFRGRRGIVPRQAVAAKAVGWRLVLDKPPLITVGHSFANVVPDPGAFVYGVAYEISAEDYAHVEFSEGVQIGNYARADLDLETLQGGTLRACTLTSEKRGTGLKPSLRYMALLIEGATEHGLPDDWIAVLRGIPAEEESEAAKAARALLDRVIRKKPAAD